MALPSSAPDEEGTDKKKHAVMGRIAKNMKCAFGISHVYNPFSRRRTEEGRRAGEHDFHIDFVKRKH
jgi:hypothetical protein